MGYFGKRTANPPGHHGRRRKTRASMGSFCANEVLDKTKLASASLFQMGAFVVGFPYLDDHPMTCKWLIAMVIVGPLSRGIPLPNGINGL